MEMQQTSLESLTARIVSLVNGSSEASRVSRHWLAILLCSFILNALIFIFSVYLFFEINFGDIFLVEGPSAPSVETINRAEFEDVLSSFETRAAAFETYRLQAPPIPDPSR